MDDLTKITLETIKPGREGWVYLIHAEGTNRYKIGRSVNPIARHQTLQGQSPYPLKITECFWTIDAITDEDYLHKMANEHRAYGEWFELEKGGVDSSYHLVDEGFMFGYVMDHIAKNVLDSFFEKVNWNQNKEEFTHFRVLISELYRDATNKKFVLSLDCFMKQELLYLAQNLSDCTTNEIHYFLIGAAHGFSLAHGKNL